MSTELVMASSAERAGDGGGQSLPVLVERAGGAARFAWDEFFYAEHHNPHTQKAYQRAVRRFLAWAEGQGVELAAITPGMVGQYLVGLGGSAGEAESAPGGVTRLLRPAGATGTSSSSTRRRRSRASRNR